MRQVYDAENVTLFEADALELLRSLPSGSTDLLLTSPPYNLLNATGGGMKDRRGSLWESAALRDGYGGTHNDNMPHEEYVAWQRDILGEGMRVLSDTGVIFYNHKWRVQGGLLQDRSDIVDGFPVRQILIWQRAGGFNFNDGYFLPTFEVIYVIAKPGFKLAQGANQHGDVWKINPDASNPHPAPFPLALADRIVESVPNNGGLVVDPFVGSGTSALAARGRGRRFVGGDKVPKYLDLAKERLAQGVLPLFG